MNDTSIDNDNTTDMTDDGIEVVGTGVAALGGEVELTIGGAVAVADAVAVGG